jgi:ribonuclease HII
VAAGVLFDASAIPDGLCDSKVLTPEEREACARDIHAAALAVSFAVADASDIDHDGLGVANQRALERAALGLRPRPEYVISDWFTLEATGLPHVGLPRADALSAAVAAASIVAKVGRDAFMASLDATYPGYGFALHKGYRSPEHWAALRALGPCPIHRRSFRGVGAYQYSFFDS